MMLRKLDKKIIEKLLRDSELLPPSVRRVLELRQGGAQAAVKKINALLSRAGDDDRIRGAFRYHGAATGRFSGQGYQPQNLKRLTIKDEELYAAIAAVATGDHEHVRARYERPLQIVDECSRPTICSAAGHVSIGGDFSAVESRGLAWIADEEWKLESYRRFDQTHDPRDEPYCITACKIFRVPDGSFTKESPERGVGKTCDLAFGYMGALGAWRKFEQRSSPTRRSRSSRPSGARRIPVSWSSGTPSIMPLGRLCASAAESCNVVVSPSSAAAHFCSCGCRAAERFRIRILASRL
jgi:DNA polymerase